MPSDFVPNNVWGSTDPNAEHEVTTPSGQRCRARKISIDGLMQAGIMTQADPLTAVVGQYIKPDGHGGQLVNERGIMGDPDAVKAMVSLADKALPHIVISPPVHMHYNERTVGQTVAQVKLTEEEKNEIRERIPGVVFTDQIDFSDKMYLFEWAANRLQAMTTFRPGSRKAVGNVAHGKRPKNKTKRRPRDN